MNQMTDFINPYKRYTGSIIPEWLEMCPTISPGAKVCYARLCRFSGKNGVAFPRIEVLAEAIGVSDRQCRRYIKELQTGGLIDIKQRGLGQSNEYRFLNNELAKDDIDVSVHDLTDVATPERTDMTGQLRTDMSVHDLTDVATPIIEENQFKRISLRESMERDARAREPNHFEKASQVLLYLNQAAGKNFEPTLINKKYIAERIQEGRAIEILKEIIDLKVAQSRRRQKNGQPIFNPTFLRPQTLFSEQNCEKYINEINEIKSGKADAFAFEGAHSKQQRRLEALRAAGLDPLRMFGYGESTS